MNRMRVLWCMVLIYALSGTQGASAQRFPGEPAWKLLIEHEGVVVKYIRYREANSVGDGVVILLENTNSYTVRYRFTVVFRSEGAEEDALAEGELMAGAMKTGDREGLFWIPFEDGRAIRQVGLRGYRFTRVVDPMAGPHDRARS